MYQMRHSKPITSTYGTINVVRINMNPGLGEFVLRVERLLVAFDNLFIPPGTLVAFDNLFIPPGTLVSAKTGRRLRTAVYHL